MRRVLVVTGSIVFLDTMLFGAIIPLLPDFADTYDLTKLEAGALLGAYGAGALVGGIPGGLLVGRIGPKRGLLLGLSVLALSSLAFALAGGPVALGASPLRPGALERDDVGGGARLGRGQHPAGTARPGARDGVRSGGARLRGRSDVRRRRSTSSGSAGRSSASRSSPQRLALVLVPLDRPAVGDGEPGRDRQGAFATARSSAACG